MTNSDFDDEKKEQIDEGIEKRGGYQPSEDPGDGDYEMPDTDADSGGGSSSDDDQE